MSICGETRIMSLLDTTAAAERLGVAKRTLEGWRRRGEGPPYVKLAAHTVRYDPDALAAWVRAKAVQSEPPKCEPPKPDFPFAQRKPARKGHHRLGGHRLKRGGISIDATQALGIQ